MHMHMLHRVTRCASGTANPMGYSYGCFCLAVNSVMHQLQEGHPHYIVIDNDHTMQVIMICFSYYLNMPIHICTCLTRKLFCVILL